MVRVIMVVVMEVISVLRAVKETWVHMPLAAHHCSLEKVPSGSYPKASHWCIRVHAHSRTALTEPVGCLRLPP